MAGRMAHDFNNLLTVINGYNDLLLSRSEAGDPINKDLQAAREAGEEGRPPGGAAGDGERETGGATASRST